MDREELLAPVIAAVQKQTRFPRFYLREKFVDWDVLPLAVGGEYLGAWVVRGTEIHFALRAGMRPRGSVRGAVRAALAPVLEKAGYLTTRLLLSMERERKFVERVGFRPTWKDEMFQYYMLSSLPFEKRKP